jgi:hypothetical protein
MCYQDPPIKSVHPWRIITKSPKPIPRPQPIRKEDITNRKQEEIDRAVDSYVLTINKILESGETRWDIPMRVSHQLPEVLNELIERYSLYWKVERKTGGMQHNGFDYLEFT